MTGNTPCCHAMVADRNRIVTIQPFREEIDRVIATYVMDDAPRQLNLSARERKQLLIALSHTTHPTAFRQVAWSVESTLRMQAHPNFIRCQYKSSPITLLPPSQFSVCCVFNLFPEHITSSSLAGY